MILEHPKAPGAPKGTCVWCGQQIEFTELATSRHRQRTRHRGDKYEKGVGGGDWPTTKRHCNREFKQSMVWNARDALRWVASRPENLDNGQYVVICVDCEDTCETGRPATSPRHGFKYRNSVVFKRWEADHEIPLADGGIHNVENLHPRCTECHRRKTRRENSRRMTDYEAVGLAEAKGEL